MPDDSVTDRAGRSRRAILDAAAEAFAEFGYTGASLNRIIETSGLTKGGFYFHFPSKLALALAVVADRQQRGMDEINAEAAQYSTAVDRLFGVPRILARMWRDGRGPAVLRKLIDELAADPELRSQVCGQLRDWVRMVALQVREAQREGAIRPDVDPDLIAEVAVGGFIGMQTLTDNLGDDGLERRIEALIQVVQQATLERQR